MKINDEQKLKRLLQHIEHTNFHLGQLQRVILDPEKDAIEVTRQNSILIVEVDTLTRLVNSLVNS